MPNTYRNGKRRMGPREESRGHSERVGKMSDAIGSEIYRLQAGLKNKDFLPGKQKRVAKKRLRELLATPSTQERERGVIRFGSAR